jgi:hypothetical protein
MKYLSHILVFLLGCLLTYCGTEQFKEPCPEYVESKQVEVIKEKIVVKEKEVIKWKEKKGSIIYTTKFDTLATIDTIYVELLKCDSIVKIDSQIIFIQDTIIADQKEAITLGEIENASLKNEVKKQKRKNIITRFGAGIIIVAILLLK